jgi:hypothetical protein
MHGVLHSRYPALSLDLAHPILEQALSFSGPNECCSFGFRNRSVIHNLMLNLALPKVDIVCDNWLTATVRLRSRHGSSQCWGKAFILPAKSCR